jgi:amidohydrolase
MLLTNPSSESANNLLTPNQLSYLVNFRQELHQYPELGFEERRTSRRIAEELRKVPGLEVQEGIAKYGVVATLKGTKSNSLPPTCVALRADIDALPIQEKTSLPYISKNQGIMHACGHDGHTACLLGAAHVLASRRDKFAGTVKFLFQPAEETLGGARYMINDGALENPKVNAIFGLHGWPAEKLGSIRFRTGPLLATGLRFDIMVTGKGAHAAMPSNAIDPIPCSAAIVSALQSIVARTTDPFDSVVVSVTKIEGGSAYNVIPDSVFMKGTIRTLNKEILDSTSKKLQTIVEGVASAFNTSAQVTFIDGYPVLVNDKEATSLLEQAAHTIFEKDSINSNCSPSLGCEDFAFYLEKAPGAFWFLGTAEQFPTPQLHSNMYNFNDKAIPYGVAMHVALAEITLEKLHKEF